MKKLYIIRHAKSSWSDPKAHDFDRKLNKRGKRDAPFMGSRLARYSVFPDAIYSSPAKRAKRTAQTIAKKIDFSRKRIIFDEQLYHTSSIQLLSYVQKIPDTVDTVFLVGHNFAITDFAEAMTGVEIFNIPTSGIVAMVFDIRHWKKVKPEGGTLLFFDFPKKHKERG